MLKAEIELVGRMVSGAIIGERIRVAEELDKIRVEIAELKQQFGKKENAKTSEKEAKAENIGGTEEDIKSFGRQSKK